MEYTLCSSSEEEGEISTSTTFPFHLSNLSYCYYPNTSLFIGDNLIPRCSDFQDSSSTTKIKKKLNREIFDTSNLCRDKSFYENKFVKQTNKVVNNEKSTYELYNVVSDYKEISEFYFLKKGLDLYLDLFNKLIYQQSKENMIFIKDSILTKIHKPNVFVHFKILKHNNILFEDSYYKSITVYEYLEMYFEEICKEYKSTEERWYKYNNYDLVVYSSSCYKNNDRVMRYYNGLDCYKNYIAVVNKKTVSIKQIDFTNKVSLDFLEFILSMNLDLGDYAYNKGEIYKICVEGDNIPYEGIDYTLIN